MTLGSPRGVDLPALVTALAPARVAGPLDRTIAAIVHDSRAARPGALFVAVRGSRVDGHAYLAAAAERGATTFVVDAAYDGTLPEHATTLVVADTRRALSRLAAAFWREPSLALDVAGITGTNGKTTTTHFVAAIFSAAGRPCGRVGTLGAHFGGSMWPLDNTTPLADELQATLAAMRERGARAVALEVSSHALALGRVDDVRFAFGVLTNVTRDHLDFHGTFDAYAAAKRTLFERAERALLSADDPLGVRWTEELRAAGRDASTYGFAPDADVRATGVRLDPHGARFAVDGRAFEIALAGRFNVQNALAALATARAAGIDDAVSAGALATVRAVPGRMERLSGGGVDVLVDYAHTPDALDVVLSAARETTRGRVVAVFGCGGDRDRGKRPEMGRIASERADRVVVTSDNPRSEDASAIVADILAGVAPARAIVVEVDRRAAIRRAIAEAAPGDVVVIAGKGHETYQLVGDAAHHFDDREEVRAALAARLAER